MSGPMQRIFRRRPASLDEATAQQSAPDAGHQPHEPAASADPGFRERGRLRRRLRYLRRARELGYRDLGGLVFDLRRFERERPDLVEAKLDALAALDGELRALEAVLGDHRAIHELREPGIASCARCGALHSSEANYCPNCGLALEGPLAMGELGGAIAAPPQAPDEPGTGADDQSAAAPDEQPTRSVPSLGERPPGS